MIRYGIQSKNIEIMLLRLFLLLRVGDMGVGKSCLLHQFTEKKCKLQVLYYI